MPDSFWFARANQKRTRDCVIRPIIANRPARWRCSNGNVIRKGFLIFYFRIPYDEDLLLVAIIKSQVRYDPLFKIEYVSLLCVTSKYASSLNLVYTVFCLRYIF
jgi:hypothetical protein